jgi:hypothetical protein
MSVLHYSILRSAGVYANHDEYATVLVKSPSISISLEFYKYEYDNYPLYRIDVGALNYIVKDINKPQGVLAETMRPRYDAQGAMVMEGQVNRYLHV